MGGRLFAVAGDSPAMEAVLITRVGDYQWREEVLFETDMKRLETPDAAAGFVF
jgi:protein-L-isoaspartate(D-aspartate) O-methyltransferase